jgi:hypothetical protein
MVQQGVLNPLRNLHSLYNGPSLAIARLYHCEKSEAVEHLESIGVRPLRLFSHYTQELNELTLVVMHELPKLYSPTIDAVEKCLSTFTLLQTAWFEALRTKLESPDLFSPTGLGEIVHWQHDSRKALEDRLSRLGICNGSLLRQNPDHPGDLDARGSENKSPVHDDEDDFWISE